MDLLHKSAKESGYIVTANPFDGLFKASLIDTQTGDKGATRKLVEMIYLAVDEDAVTIKKNGKDFTAEDVRNLDQFKSDEAKDLYILGGLIEDVIITTEETKKK